MKIDDEDDDDEDEEDDDEKDKDKDDEDDEDGEGWSSRAEQSGGLFRVVSVLPLGTVDDPMAAQEGAGDGQNRKYKS